MDRPDRQVFVYILTSNVRSASVENVKRIFSDKLFNVIPATINSPLNGGAAERDKVFTILRRSAAEHPNNACVIVKENSISFLPPNEIAKTMDAIVSGTAGNFHLFYLSKWLDDCSAWTNNRQKISENVVVVKTRSPHGIQAICFSPEGRTKILNNPIFANSENLSYDFNKSIQSGELDVLCTIGNIIQVDPLTIEGDWYKLNECNVDQPSIEPRMKPTFVAPDPEPNNSAPWLWIIIALIILCLVLSRR